MLKNINMPFRLKVAGIHLLISLLIAVLSAVLVFCVWYPNPLQKAVGVTHIFFLVMVVDVISGSLLTLLVASSKQKKSLKFDLSVIVLLQLAAYVYGMHSIVISRPAYVAFDTARFEVVQADTVVRDDIQKTLPKYQSNPWWSLEWVAVRPYKNVQEQAERMKLEFEQAISPSMQAYLYQSMDLANVKINTIKKPLNELKKFNEANQIDKILEPYPQATHYLPLRANAVDMTVLVDKEGKVVKIVDLRPW